MITIDNKETSIAIINVFFGKLPTYFNLWLHSASYNSNIDFYVFGDGIYNGSLPQNVRMISCELDDVRKRASVILEMQCVLDTPYKLCDYKVLYGLIFQEYIKQYDYWGHCDLDLIWGDLEKCFIENHLNKYDKFFPLGHLSLYRNTDDVNKRIIYSGGGYKEL